MRWVYDDGGRAAAGYRGATRDCFARSVAIALGWLYQDAYDAINRVAKRERPSRRTGWRRSHARTGVYRKTAHRLLVEEAGWTWVSCMAIGSGCTVHMRGDELPADRVLIVNLSRHFSVVRFGEIRDTFDPSRNGTRCVYGAWQPPGLDVAWAPDFGAHRRDAA